MFRASSIFRASAKLRSISFQGSRPGCATDAPGAEHKHFSKLALLKLSLQVPYRILRLCCSLLACIAILTPACCSSPPPQEEEDRSSSQPGERAQQTGRASSSAAAPMPTSVWSDADNDGIPDGAELKTYADRENFRHWFTYIAEMQFYKTSDAWNAEQRDCAGLVRFAWREALRRHDRLWLQKMGEGYQSVAPDVRAYNLASPADASSSNSSPLGEKLFRTRYGPFQQSDLASDVFSDFADARTLKNFSCIFISRDRRRALPGDLLFFNQAWAQNYPFHVMIFLGAARYGGEGATDWVVYHTGASPHDQGVVKKVRLSVLDEHPDRRWRPLENNRNFLGFYRLKILD